MTFDEKMDMRDAFAAEFKALVRKHIDTVPEADKDEMKYILQDETSVFSPYIWDDAE